ncbi:hypothetical protein ACN4EG_17180 [Alkalinema pantanalense CENA528]|uniref:hypothetical protein n=1 Tax=Alkalinema pantanalense TaxID=1620705 RepID=UPI003D6E0FF1
MNNLQSQSLDPLAQNAISMGIESINQTETLEKITLEFDQLSRHKLKRLANSLTLSVRTVIESAINYTCSYIIESDTTLNDLWIDDLPNPTFPVKITLSLETTKKLEQVGMSQSINQCAIIGINLLYDRLLSHTPPIHD